MSANLSVPSLPKPTTGISQGSAFASAPGNDAPKTLVDAFANFLNTGTPAAPSDTTETSKAPGLTLSNNFSTSASASTDIGLALPGSPLLQVGLEAATGGDTGDTGDNLIAQIANLLAGKKPEAPAVEAGIETEAGLVMADPVTAPEPESEADEPSLDAAALLSSLLQALNLLQDRLAQGATPDPTLTKSIEDTLGALADLMGMPADALEDMLAPQLNATALPATLSGQLSLADIAKLNAAAGSNGATPAVPAVPASADQPAQPATPAVPPAHAGQHKTDLDALTAKLAELAKTVAPSDPGLASKLQALSQNLAAAQPDLIAKLGFDAHLQLADADTDAALTSLIATRTPEKAPVPTPSIAAPVLDLPDAIKTAEKPVLAPSAEPVKPQPAPLEATKPEVAPRSAEAVKPDAVKPRGEPAPQASAAAPAPDAKPDQPVTNNAAGLPPVRADGIAAGARAVQAAYQTPHTQVNLPQMAYEIVRHVSDGHNRFQIRLDPAELGRIDVRMDIDNKGTLNARLTVERAETLDLLQRDQRALEKALAQAGLDSSKTNLEFSLKQNPFGRQDNGQGQGRDGNPSFTGGETKSVAEEPATTIPATLYRGAATASGVNLFV